MRRNVAMAAAALAVLAAVFGGSPSATAIPPDIDLGPTSMVFGVVNQGQTSAPQDVVVTNTSGRPIGPITVDGAVPPPDGQVEVFELDDRCTGLVLQPGDRCALAYTFTPYFNTVSVARLDVQVFEGAGPDPVAVGAVFRVTLAGAGTNPIQVVPTVVDVGSVPVGATSAPVSLRLRNPSDQPFGPLNLGGTSQPPQPPFAADDSGCWGAVLPPGGSCEILITFRPELAGRVVASASVGVSGTGNRASVEFAYQLQGCGDTPAAPCAAVTPAPSTSTSSTTVETTTTSGVGLTTTTVAGPVDTVAGTTTAPGDGSTPPVGPGSGVSSAGAALPRTGSGSPVPLVATGTLLLVVGAAAVLTARRRRLAA